MNEVIMFLNYEKLLSPTFLLMKKFPTFPTPKTRTGCVLDWREDDRIVAHKCVLYGRPFILCAFKLYDIKCFVYLFKVYVSMRKENEDKKELKRISERLPFFFFYFA